MGQVKVVVGKHRVKIDPQGNALVAALFPERLAWEKLGNDLLAQHDEDCQIVVEAKAERNEDI
jgi:hypothetical protein